jgi:hypothetical protein
MLHCKYEVLQDKEKAVVSLIHTLIFNPVQAERGLPNRLKALTTTEMVKLKICRLLSVKRHLATDITETSAVGSISINTYSKSGRCRVAKALKIWK